MFGQNLAKLSYSINNRLHLKKQYATIEFDFIN